jgi:hypothetical protein
VPYFFTTLAKAYAAFGQFEKAAEVQSKAISVAEERGRKEEAKKYREELADYTKILTF